jgi:ribonuclease BN (tRNA processing enzyme)
MLLTVAGCGTAVPDGSRASAGYVIDAGAARVLFDCGPGVVHGLARAGIDWPGITHVCISHFHNDHIGDLPFLFFAWKYGTRPTRSAAVMLAGPVGLRAFVEALPDALGAHVRNPGYPVEICELPPGAALQLAPDVHLSTHVTPHTTASVAFRIEQGGSSIGYTGDTGPSAELGDFFRGVDLLITECSLPDDQTMPSHLSPVSVAQLANRASPARLLLTHIYPQLDRDSAAGLVRRAGWNGDIMVAHDGLSLRI